MEDLLLAVTSVRKNLQERRTCRLKKDSVSVFDFNFPLNSPKIASPALTERKSAKAEVRVPGIRIPAKAQDEFSRYLATPQSGSISKSPSRGRSYKLDAASLLMSRVNKFLSKHFCLWKKNADKIRNAESKLFNNKDLVFKINISKAVEKKRYFRDESSGDEPENFSSIRQSRSPGKSPLNTKKRLSIDIQHAKMSNELDLKSLKEARKIPATARAGKTLLRSQSQLKMLKIRGLFSLVKRKTIESQKVAFKVLENFWKVRKIENAVFLGLRRVFKTVLDRLKKADGVFKVQKGLEKVKKVVFGRISDEFFFMKFRTVIESGLFEESDIVESSQDNLKEYIESLEKKRKERSVTHKSISYFVNAPSFMNLITEIESSVKRRYLGWFLSAARQVPVQLPKSLCKEKRKLSLWLRAFENSLFFMKNCCFCHWKSFNTHLDPLPLQLLTFISTFNSLAASHKKYFFSIYKISKFSKYEKNQKTNPKKAIKLIIRYLKFNLKTAFHSFFKPSPSLRQTLSFIYFQLSHKLRASFRTWSRRVNEKRSIKLFALKSICSLFKSLLSLHFSHWKNKLT